MKRLAFVLLAVVVVASRGASAQDPARLLKAAMDLELVDHDPKAAIEQYKKVVATGDRALAAQALLRMAGCYEKLGDAEGQKRTLQQILKNHPSQPEATEARRRLGNSSVTVSKRLVWTPPKGVTFINVSPDGRYALCSSIGIEPAGIGGISLSFTVNPKTGSGPGLSVHELATGSDRRLATPKTDGGGTGSVGGRAAWSRDSTKIAYTLRISGPAARSVRSQLRVVDARADGSNPDQVLVDNPEIRDVVAYDWTSDGKQIAATVDRVDGTRQIALVSAVDGSFKILKTLGWRGAGPLMFSSDGRFLAFGIAADDSSRRRVGVMATDGGSEVSIGVSPADDSPLGWSKDGSELYLLRRNAASDQLWAATFKTKGKPAELRLVRDLGLVDEEATLTLSGALFVHEKPRPDSTLLTASFDFASGMVVSKLTEAVGLFGTTASEELSSFRFSPDGRFVAYRHRVRRAGEAITVRDIATGLAREFPVSFQPDYQGPVWSPDGRSVAFGGSELDGRRHGLFSLDAATGKLIPIVVTTSADDLLMDYGTGGQPWSADSKKFYFLRVFEGGGKGRVLVERDLASGEERELIERGSWVTTLSPDKRKLYYYDVNKVDNVLIERDLTSGTERELAKGVTGNPTFSPDGQFLLTQLKRTATSSARPFAIALSGARDPNVALQAFVGVVGWAPDSQSVIAAKSASPIVQAEYWWVPLDLRTPRRLTEFEGAADERLAIQSIHPNGRLVVVGKTSLRALPPAEVWVFENLLGTPRGAR